MGKRQEVVHINHNEIEILEKLGTWLIDFHNYDVSELAEGEQEVFISKERYEQLKNHSEKLSQMINGINAQIMLKNMLPLEDEQCKQKI